MDRRYARTLFFLAAALLVGDGSIPPAATAAATAAATWASAWPKIKGP